MTLGDILKFSSEEVVGYELRDKIHVFIAQTDHYLAPNEFSFLFISSSDYGNCFPILRSDYEKILDHDSFISCGNLVFYSRQYLNDMEPKRLGQIKSEHLIQLRNHLIGHEFMEGWQIKVTCDALAAVL